MSSYVNVFRRTDFAHARGRYIKAFLTCRKHRLDLSLIVEHDQAAFLSKIKDFVEQVDHVDHINLFLSSVGYG